MTAITYHTMEIVELKLLVVLVCLFLRRMWSITTNQEVRVSALSYNADFYSGVAVYTDTKSPQLERLNHIHSNGLPQQDGASDPMDIDVCGGSHVHAHTHKHIKQPVADVILREGKAVYPRSGGRRDETMEIVSFLAEKAIQSKLCTFMLTRGMAAPTTHNNPPFSSRMDKTLETGP